MLERSEEKELIDLGRAHYSTEEYADCLQKLGKIGKWLGGDRASFQAFDRFVSSPRSILDVGCGGGFFTRRLAYRYPQAQVVGIDTSKEAIAYAQKQKPCPSNIEFLHTPQEKLDYSPQSFDVVTATLVCHHLSDGDLLDFLQRARSIARQAVIINDLHRHPLAARAFRFIAPKLFPNRLIIHDGLISIRRAFTKQDWLRYANLLNISSQERFIAWRFAFRWIFVLFPPLFLLEENE